MSCARHVKGLHQLGGNKNPKEMVSLQRDMYMSKRELYIPKRGMYMSRRDRPGETSIFLRGASRVDACGIASARIVQARRLDSKGALRAFHSRRPNNDGKNTVVGHN